MTKFLSRPHRFSWQQTMLRIKDPLVSVPFYENNFGMKLLHKYDFPQWKFSLYFMITPPAGVTLPEPGTLEAETYLWNMDYVCLELTHNHGSETDDNFKVNNGNVEPHRGFGHIAMMTKDVYGACDKMEAAGLKFQKKPNEGKMKGLAFVLDPDGYWIEVISRAPESPVQNEFTLAQTMLRIKDPVKSLRFYKDILGMDLISKRDFGVGTDWGFSLYFLANLTDEQRKGLPDPESPEAGMIAKTMFQPVLELTHNHGTENQPEFKYHNGNDDEAGQGRGFGHTGFLVDNLEEACAWMEAEGVVFKKRPQEGNMHTLAFAYDPDFYWVEIIQRGFNIPK